MAEQLTPLQEGTDLNQAVRFHSRERRRSLAGIPELSRTHYIFGGTVMAVSAIPMAAFPSHASEITFKTAIRIIENAGVHRGLVFSFGTTIGAAALWIEDDKIGFRAGGGVAGFFAASIFDNGVELPPGLELELVVSASPGMDKTRLWGNGQELARATSASNMAFWAVAGDGSFADAPAAALPGDVPGTSQVAPDGFDVIEPLSAYVGQKPRHFF